MAIQLNGDFRGKRVLITGGTSGLGLALAEHLASLGARVAVVSRTRRYFEPMSGIISIQGDVSQKDAIYPIAGEAQALLGGVDLLVNNASALGPTPLRPLLDTECEDLSFVLETNLLGPFRLTKAILPGMILRGEGIVLNISSDAAVSAYPNWGAYGASKAALHHLTRIWAEELKGQGVQFFSIDPGDMDTPMHEAAIPDADKSTLLKPKDAAARILAFVFPKEEVS